MVIDPLLIHDMPAMEKLLRELKGVKPAVSASSHFHDDHCDGIPYLQKEYGVKAYLHPLVNTALRQGDPATWPWFPTQAIQPDGLWPEKGKWSWREYAFRVAPWPGQTWWHCAFMTRVDGYKVFFGGDNFQPPSRWNGTGGFCAFNGSRFNEGFIPSARLVLDWKPDIIAAGHDTYCHFSALRFKKIMRWAGRTEKIIADLCPSGDLEKDYYALKNITVAPRAETIE